jgi:membrane protease YdiL (CAAX protease family)
MESKKKEILIYFFIILSPVILFLLLWTIFVILGFLKFNFYNNFLNKLKNDQWFNLVLSLLLQFFLLFILPFSLLLIKNKKIDFYSNINSNDFINIFKFLFVVFLFATIIQSLIFDIFIKDEYFSKDYIEKINVLFNNSKILSFIFIVILAPISEEFYFRGLFSIIRKNIKKSIFIWFYLIIPNIFFSFLHFDFDRLTYLLIIGISFSYIYLITNNLIYSTIFHFFINFLGYFGLFFNSVLIDNFNKVNINTENIYKTTNLTVIGLKLIFVFLLFCYIFKFIKTNIYRINLENQ